MTIVKRALTIEKQSPEMILKNFERLKLTFLLLQTL